jgi:hypothetical protein
MPSIASLHSTPESDAEYSRVKPRLEKVFYDSFQVLCKPMENSSHEPLEIMYQHPTATMRNFLSHFCWKEGPKGDLDRSRKFKVDPNDATYQNPIEDPTVPCKLLVKTADIPVFENL